MSDSEQITDQPGIEPGNFRLLDGEEHWFNYIGHQLQFLSSNIF